MKPTLVLVGGFLGAGKTTLLLAAGQRLRRMGKRVGIITNDQGGELVDTRFARAAGFDTAEVTGGCFCCRFSEFVRSADRLLAERSPDVLLAEPVGSCTDLSATMLQPIKKFYRDRFRLAPLTVLVDPERAEALLAPDADPELSYLFRKQVAEADLVRFTKADLASRFPEIPGARPISAATGEGVAEWLEEVLDGDGRAGLKLLEIDYDAYARAERKLGWLNWQADLHTFSAKTPAWIAGRMLTGLDAALSEGGIAIAHLKVFVEGAGGAVKASLTRNGAEPSIDGTLDAPPARRLEMVLNLRAVSAPEALETIARHVAAGLPGRLRVRHAECFQPAPPTPEQRLSEVML